MDNVVALTAKAEDKLARVSVSQGSAQAAEITTLFRFTGGLHLVAGSIMLETELGSGAVARHLRSMLAELYDVKTSLNVLSPGGLRKASKYIVRVAVGAELVARQTSLIDSIGHPVHELPRKLIMRQRIDQGAIWRGAFLAHGSLTESGRSSALEVTAPSAEAALALVGCAYRLGITAKGKESKPRGGDHIIIREDNAIDAFLTRMGAQITRLQWEEQCMRRKVRATATHSANFDDANLRCSARMAVIAAARIKRALEILGDGIPGHLVFAGQLYIEHKQASLEELRQLANPPMTKDTVAGCIRRLLSMADKRTNELGTPPTTAVVTDEFFDKEVDE